MTELFESALVFPTVVFTILLGVTAAYWIFVMLGALDVDLLGELDGEVVDLDGDGEPDGFAGVLQALGLGGVPLTLVLSLLVLASWAFCLVAMQLVGIRPAGWVAAGAAVLSVVLAVPLTALAVRPLRRFFVSHPALQNRSLVGKVCTITTLGVDQRYGQAEVDDGGAGLLVQVRYSGPSRLSRGDRALIFDYKDEVFQVAPVGEALQRSLEETA